MTDIKSFPVFPFLTWCLRIAGVILIGFFVAAKRIPRNRWGGIRFSYTLADDEVWRKTHEKMRWWLLVTGLVCFYPIDSYKTLTNFTPVLLSLLILFSISSWIYARRIYRDKFGTTKVVTLGLFKYAPPTASEETDAESPHEG